MGAEGPYHNQKARSITITTTGNIDNLDLDGAGMLLMNNASLATIRGIVGGYHGQIFSCFSIGAGQVDFAHQNVNSTAAYRFINWVTSGNTPLAPGTGSNKYQYDAITGRWRILSHEQGDWLTPAFSAGDYTASVSMTWTVASGDVLGNSYRVSGKSITRAFNVVTTTVGGVLSNELRSANPAGYTAASRVFAGGVMNDNGTARDGYLDTKAAANTYVGFFLSSGANWVAAADNTAALSSITFPLT